MSNNRKIQRHLEAVLSETVSNARIVNIIGPRQVGKTTLVRDLFKAGRYVTLDDDNVMLAIKEDAAGQLASLTSDLGGAPLVIDEVQHLKELALPIKIIVDKNWQNGQFVLTGSSNAFIMADAADSLAGRMRTLKLWPLTMAEIRSAEPNKFLYWALQTTPTLSQIAEPEVLSRADYILILLQGGFPGLINMDLVPRQRQYRDYVDQIVDRDVASVMLIRKTDLIRRFIDQIAARTAEELNITTLASLLNTNRKTVEKYLDVMTRLSLVIRLGAWTSSESSREIKNEKIHFVDTGMSCALRRFKVDSFDAGKPTASELGHLLETFVFGEILRSLPLHDQDYRLYHWRSRDQREIDIIVDGVDRLVGIEVKASSSVSKSDFRHLRWFGSDGPGKTRSFTGVVFYLGAEKLTFGNNMFALPVSTLWSDIAV